MEAGMALMRGRSSANKRSSNETLHDCETSILPILRVY
jgi:hypothetical protein